MSIALRLYADGDESPRPEEMRMREAFETFLLPTLKRTCDQPHITQHYTAIQHWERLTDNPPVSLIDDQKLQSFADALLAWHVEHGKRGRTNTHKNFHYLGFILRACCRRGSSNKRGQPSGRHLIEDLPIAHPPAVDAERKRVAQIAEVSAAYEAVPQAATWPRSRGRTLWDGPIERWRLLLVLDYNFGPRTEELLKLSWESIHWEPLCPAPEMSRLEWRFGWLVYTPPKTRKSKPAPLFLPLTECARLHLDAMRPSRNPTGPIFGFPKNKRSLYATLDAIWLAAGVAQPYSFQELRKTCSTTWNDLWPGLGKHVVGHAPRGVNSKHYDSDLRRLCRFAPQLPQPESMLKAVGLESKQSQSAKAALTERLGTLSEEHASLLLKLADNMAS